MKKLSMKTKMICITVGSVLAVGAKVMFNRGKKKTSSDVYYVN